MGGTGASLGALFDGSLLRRVFARYRALLDEAQCRLFSHAGAAYEVRLAAATLAVDSVLVDGGVGDDLRGALRVGRDEMIAALAEVP